jgi:two-component sensor histidine kinase
VNSELAGFSERVHISGVPLVLSASAAQTFALIVHELSTNASKYGSLSNADGEVDVSWVLSSTDAKPCLDFDWTEHGGPTVINNRRSGFGFSLIASMGQSLTGSPVIDLRPEGLVCRLKVPLETITSTRPSIENEFMRDFRA